MNKTTTIPQKTMANPNTLLILNHNPLTPAIAHVLTTLLDIKHQYLNPATQETDQPFPHPSILILTENQIFRNLAQLRQQNYTGAILVLSDKSTEQTKENHPILRYGISSHAILPFFNHLTTLIQQITQLIPIGEDNLNDLQERLNASAQQIDQDIIPLLNGLEKDDYNRDQNLDLLEKNFLNLLQYTPDFSHEKFIPNDPDSPRIRTKFSDTLDTIRTCPEHISENLAVLHQISQRWRNHVLMTGEGLDCLPQ